MKKNLLISLILVIGTPLFVNAQVGIAPIAESQAYSVVTVSPDARGNEKLEALKIKIQLKLNGISDRVMETAKAGLLQPKTLNSAFGTLATAIQDELKPFILEINKDLPADDGIVYTAYVLPFPKDEKAKMITLPLVNQAQIIEADLGKMAEVKKAGPAEFYSLLKTQIANIKATKANQFQVAAVATHLKLERNNVYVRFQLLGELKSGSREFTKANEQVVINDLEILSDPVHNLRPMALMNITQKIAIRPNESTAKPEIFINFGSYGGIGGGIDGWENSLLILDDALNPSNTCAMKFNTVPSFFGILAHKATGNFIADWALQNKPVRFRILSLRIDAETQRISSMQMATQIGMAVDPYTSLTNDPENGKLFNCLSIKTVDDKFKAEGNDAIDAALKEMTSQPDVTPELMNALYE